MAYGSKGIRVHDGRPEAWQQSVVVATSRHGGRSRKLRAHTFKQKHKAERIKDKLRYRARQMPRHHLHPTKQGPSVPIPKTMGGPFLISTTSRKKTSGCLREGTKRAQESADTLLRSIFTPQMREA